MSSSGSVSFTSIKMKSPKSAVYLLIFTSSNNLVATTATISVNIGPPHRLVASLPDQAQCSHPCQSPGSILCCRSSFSTSLPPIVVSAVDAGGEYVGSTQKRNVTVQASFSANASATWTGNNSLSMKNGQAIFDDLVLHKPTTGYYVIDFVADDMIGMRFLVEIRVGDPSFIVIVDGMSSGPYSCVANTMLDDVKARLSDAGGTMIDSLVNTVTLSLTVTDGQNEVISTRNYDVLPQHSTAVWTNLNTYSPKTGQLTVTISGPATLASIDTSFNVTIVSGAATKFKAVITSSSMEAGPLAKVPAIHLQELDAGDNTAAVGTENRTVVTNLFFSGKMQPSILPPHTTFLSTGTADIENMYLIAPLKNNYVLQINVSSLGSNELDLWVVNGLPDKLQFELPLPTESDNTNPLKIAMIVQDGATNPISDRKVTVEVQLASSGATLDGTKTQISQVPSARVEFSDLILRGSSGSVYTLLFTVDGYPQIGSNISIPIQSCSARLPGSIPIPPEGRDCYCPPGRTPSSDKSKCIECDEGMYKAGAGAGACSPCKLPHTISAKGAISEDYCKCQPGYYYRPNPGECIQCDGTIALCPGGDLLSPNIDTMGPIHPKKGNWRAVGAPAWDIFPCPAGVACMGGVNGSLCEPNYHGPLCSLCNPTYAKQGNICYKCAEDGVNALIMLAVAAIIFALLRYYVRKQMLGGRSPEATVFKVIINYIQVIAFVGGFRARWESMMGGFYTTLGAATNMEVLSIQPIDCLFQADYYGYFFFYASLLPMSFIFPWAMYHIGATIRLANPFRLIKSQLRGRSTRQPSTPTSHTTSHSSRLKIAMWPMTLFVLHVIPSLVKRLVGLYHDAGRRFQRKYGGMWEKMAGENLSGLVSEEDQDGPSRLSTAVDETTMQQTRRHAKRVGAVLFEEDPMLGRTSMSATKGAFWILFFLLLPTLIKNTMELFRCRDISGVHYIDKDLAVLCGTPLHTGVIYFFWLVLMPVIVVLILYSVYKNVIIRKRRQLVQYLAVFNMCWEDQTGRLILPAGTDENVAGVLRRERMLLRRLRKYMYLFSGYRTKGVLYMWDLVIMARKIAIATILVFARHELVLQIFLALLVFIAALILHLYFKPFDDEYAKMKNMRVLPSTLELVSIVATIFTLMAGLLFNFKSTILTYFSVIGLDWIVFIVNMIVLLTFIWLLFDAFRLRISYRVASFVSSQLYSEAAHISAEWWQKHVGCCKWGADRIGGREPESIELSVGLGMTPYEEKAGGRERGLGVATTGRTRSEAVGTSLPEGWEAIQDPKSGRTYYQNRKQKLTQWEKPSEGSVRI